ncbi:hypothetical protein CEUSTIGMA_g11251.t1 [Chlamydomonas eustigma]|uniref:GST C-terminal domain-containing protein n=1 Tax=Chlamydomonas eustigma TaxID=1157962 RepID=A0A250XL79_9CHLO|nr:hypothetical protein CEUSTIGMA_g11251.t1 [Chlamydomonas eustigma]|eukprot:GAX83827.1 hypothetical protein CEUSTIGMA_g11251.t1 [Chlamydomonas eustigma]
MQIQIMLGNCGTGEGCFVFEAVVLADYVQIPVLVQRPFVKGRGEYIRLIFEEAGISYEEPGRTGGMEAVASFCWKGGNPHFPARAPPIVQCGDFVLCNTPAIQAYLGKRFGLMPENMEGAAHVESLLNIVTDAVAEGRLAYHPKDYYSSHKGQEEASVSYIKQYVETRLPKYIQYFQDVLAKNPCGGCFLVGDKLSVADLAVFHYMKAAEHHFKEAYESLIINTPLLFMLVQNVSERPKIKAYLSSDRCLPWDTDSMM